MKLTIVPFESVPAGPLTRAIAGRLRRVLPWRFAVAAVQADPPPIDGSGALDVEQLLSVLPPGDRHDELVVAFVGRDLVVPGLGRVFGYAAPSKRAACISLYGLADGAMAKRGGRRLLVERAAKETLHEAGHLMGVPHCTHPGCVMQFSQTLHDTDIKDCGFCTDCLREMSRLPEPAAEMGGTGDGL